jgi:CHRD domain
MERTMSMFVNRPRIYALLTAASLALSGASALAKDVKVSLSGTEETPPVTTSASASGTIKISHDGAVSGSIKATGIDGIAAHIHVGAPGQAGPPIITLDKGADGVWSVPAGSKLTDEQLASFKAGNLYVNVHSAEHKPGEIRAQLKP